MNPCARSLGLALLLLSPLGVWQQQALACSRVFSSVNGKAMVVGRTMDLFISDQAGLALRPRGLGAGGMLGVADANALKWNSKYGNVGVLSLGKIISDGLNEKGLSANLLYLGVSSYPRRSSAQPGISNLRMVEYVLDHFATVAEALEGLKRVQVVSDRVLDRPWGLHLSLADRSGASAVVEFVNGVMKVHQGKETFVMTNEPELDWQLHNLKRYRPFGGALPLPGDIDPASRFVRASTYLKTLPLAKSTAEAEANVAAVMNNVAVPAGANDYSAGVSEDTWLTLWTTIANLSDGLYAFQLAANPFPVWVNLRQMDWQSGAGMRVLDVQSPRLTGDVSAQLSRAPLQHDSAALTNSIKSARTSP
jgi:choloylglycine hydrolase